MNHKFCHSCGEKLVNEAEICPKCGVRQNQISKAQSRNKVGAALFAIFLGPLGLHKFYLGKSGIGVVYILITILTFGIGAAILFIISFIEGIMFLTMSDESFNAKYN